MTYFFNKNRQSATRWEKKQVSSNSQNDRFTFYAQMQPYTISQHSQNHKMISTLSESQTPVVHTKINQMKDTLKNLEIMNSGIDHRYNISIDFDTSNQHSIQNSRTIHHQLNNSTKNNTKKDKRQQFDNINKYKESLNIKPSFFRDIQRLEQKQISTPSSNQLDYNAKLDLMKQRLQKISQKEMQNESNQGRVYSFQTPQTSIYFKNKSLKTNSQQSTKREAYNSKQIKKDKGKKLEREIVFDKDKKSKAYIQSSKNTAPIQTIIHEDFLQQQDTKNLQLLALAKNEKNIRYFQREKQQKSIPRITGGGGMKLLEKESKSKSYNNTLSTKKFSQNRPQYYHELYPTLSEQLEMKIYKQAKAGNQYDGLNEDRRRENYKQLRDQLQLLKSGIWVQSQKFTHQKSAIILLNQSRQSIRRRESSENRNNLIEKEKQSSTPILQLSSPEQNQHEIFSEKLSPYSIVLNQNKSKLFQLELNQRINKVVDFKIHRASINQVIIDQCPLRKGYSIYTASADYSIKYHSYNHEQKRIYSKELGSHRGSVTCLKKIQNLLFSTGKDMYLKCYNIKQDEKIVQGIESTKMYRFQKCPNKIIQKQNGKIVVGSKQEFYLFQIQKCQVIRKIESLGGILLQSGNNTFIGHKHSLSVLDFRCDNPNIQILTGLPFVENWISHPFKDMFLACSDNRIQSFNINYPKLLTSIDQSTNVFNLKLSQSIVDSAWNSRDSYRSSSSGKLELFLLLEEVYENSDRSNQLVKIVMNENDLFFNNNQYVQFQNVALTNNSIFRKSRISKSLNIVRSYDNFHFVGDKSGNLSIIDWNYHQQGEIRKRAVSASDGGNFLYR